MELKDYSVDTLCRWYKEFNSWGWPDDYPVSKPDDYDGLPIHVHNSEGRTKHNVIDCHTSSIEKLVPEYILLQWYHLNILGYSLERSNDFIAFDYRGMTHELWDRYIKKWEQTPPTPPLNKQP